MVSADYPRLRTRRGRWVMATPTCTSCSAELSLQTMPGLQTSELLSAARGHRLVPVHRQPSHDLDHGPVPAPHVGPGPPARAITFAEGAVGYRPSTSGALSWAQGPGQADPPRHRGLVRGPGRRGSVHLASSEATAREFHEVALITGRARARAPTACLQRCSRRPCVVRRLIQLAT